MKKILLSSILVGFAAICSNAQEGGCLNAVNGQYPGQTYTPECSGIPENIVTTGWAGEYSKVQLTVGVTYTFSSSISTDYLTISDNAGQTVLKFGTASVEFAPETDMVVRFYCHKDSNCNEDQEDRARIVQCGDTLPEPDYGCSQNYNAGTIAFASPIEPNYGKTANDFFVPKNSGTYTLNKVKVLMYAMAGSNTDFTTFDVRILNDNAGTPGTEIYSKTDMAPFNFYEPGDLYMGYRLFWVTLDLGEVPLELNTSEYSRYWMVFQSHSLNNMNMFWVLYPYTEGWTTQPSYLQTGNSWSKVTNFGNGDHYDGFMEIEASCDQMAINDMSGVKFSYYPNPVKDLLNIDSNRNIKSVVITNTAEQSVLKTTQTNNGKISTTSLTPGVYIVKVMLDGGQLETFKLIKR